MRSSLTRQLRTSTMPVLKDNRRTETTNIPSVEGSEVELYGELLVADMDLITREGQTNAQSAIAGLSRLIKSWNLTTEDGTPLPVNAESIKLLTVDDLTYLMSKTSYGEGLKSEGKSE